MKSIIFSVELIVAVFLLLTSGIIIYYGINLDYEKIKYIDNKMRLYSFIYSIDNYIYTKHKTNNQNFWSYLKDIIEYSGFKSNIYVEEYDIIYINEPYFCAIFLYPTSENDFLDININNKCEYYEIAGEWYYININRINKNNITINLGEILNIDPYSIFAYYNGIPVNISLVNITNKSISISLINNTHIDNLIIYFRNKTKIHRDLEYLSNRYKLVDNIDNPEVYDLRFKLSRWKTLIVKNCGQYIYLSIRPARVLEKQRIEDIENCYANYSVVYTFRNFYRDRVYKSITPGLQPKYTITDLILTFPIGKVVYHAS